MEFPNHAFKINDRVMISWPDNLGMHYEIEVTPKKVICRRAHSDCHWDHWEQELEEGDG